MKSNKPDLTIVAMGDHGGAGPGADAGAPGGPGTSVPATDQEPDADDREQCVPLSALAMPDDQEQQTPPEVGDMVSYQVEGKVTRIEGDEAYVQPSSVNGQDVGPKAAEPAEPSEDDQDQQDYSDLQGMAKQQGMLS